MTAPQGPKSDSPTRVLDPASPAWGLATRRMAWRLTWRGWLLLLTVLFSLLLVLWLCVYSFLAPNQPLPSGLLIVEGWSPSYTTKQIADVFRSGHFQKVLVLRPVGDSTNKYESGRFSGDYMVNLLVQRGVPQDCVSGIFPPIAGKDRTYHSALAAKRWLVQQGISFETIDVATLGPHARRSRLLFQKAFGRDTKVGIIPLDDLEYDPAHWWRASEGVREVVGEGIAYLYARILFHPSRADNETANKPLH